MTKSIDDYLHKIVSASDGPRMAEILCDDLNTQLIKKREKKSNFLKKMAKGKCTQQLRNLELAISMVMRQSHPKNNDVYAMVIDRIHKTGLDPLFKGPMPPQISTTIIVNGGEDKNNNEELK